MKKVLHISVFVISLCLMCFFVCVYSGKFDPINAGGSGVVIEIPETVIVGDAPKTASKIAPLTSIPNSSNSSSMGDMSKTLKKDGGLSFGKFGKLHEHMTGIVIRETEPGSVLHMAGARPKEFVLIQGI